jgi:hypothetical protein
MRTLLWTILIVCVTGFLVTTGTVEVPGLEPSPASAKGARGAIGHSLPVLLAFMTPALVTWGVLTLSEGRRRTVISLVVIGVVLAGIIAVANAVKPELAGLLAALTS